MKINSKNQALLIFALLVIVAALLFHLLSSSRNSSTQTPSTISTRKQDEIIIFKNEPETPPSRELDVEASHPANEEQEETTVNKVEVDLSNESELQPRTFATFDFSTMSQLPPDFKTENLILTQEGLCLQDPAPGELDNPRKGVLESSTEVLEFNSNAVTPLWHEDLPDGSDVFIEVSMSPDGENWGMWHWIEVDDDSLGQIREFYPDGTPNPHYGYTPGFTLAWGLRQWAFYRFRITLYSDAGIEESPTLSAFRLYYQDTTLGEGHLAELNTEDQKEGL